MAGRASQGIKYVQPVLSANHAEARRRALNLYKAFYRILPRIIFIYDVPRTDDECVQKLREMFRKNDHVTDLRTKDHLIIKGYQEFDEFNRILKMPCHVMSYWHEPPSKPPSDFLSKFFSGHD